MDTRRRLGIAALLTGMVAAAWLAFSPYWCMSKMRDAVASRDAAAVGSYIDYPTLRTNMKTRISAIIAHKASSQGSGPLGAAMAAAFVGPLVDAMVTPEMMSRMLTGEGTARGVPNANILGKEPRIRRVSLKRFIVKDDDPDHGGAVFEMRGFEWRLVDVEIPDKVTI